MRVPFRSSKRKLQIGPLSNLQKNSREVIQQGTASKGGQGAGKETLNLLDVVDVVDAGDVVQGLVVYGLRRPRRLRRPGWWFEAPSVCEFVEGMRGSWFRSIRRGGNFQCGW